MRAAPAAAPPGRAAGGDVRLPFRMLVLRLRGGLPARPRQRGPRALAAAAPPSAPTADVGPDADVLKPVPGGGALQGRRRLPEAAAEAEGTPRRALLRAAAEEERRRHDEEAERRVQERQRRREEAQRRAEE
ncbi:unnamed protein product, partial [Prorocentrum cordatum]